LEEIDILLAAAQIGVALAGFAAIATVVGQSYKGTDPRVNSIRVRGLLETALSVTLLAFVAVLLLKIEGLNTWVWRISSIVGLLTLVTGGRAVIKRDIPLRNLPGYNKPVARILFVILSAMLVAFALNIAGIAGPFAFHVYLGALILMLTTCCIWFVLVIISLLERLAESGTNSDE